MTDGEGRVRFQYAECPEGREEVRLAIPTPFGNDPRGHDVDPGGGGGRRRHHEDEEEEEEEEVEGSGRRRWSPEIREPELEADAGPMAFGVRVRGPVRDPDCVSEEEEEEQPYPALAPGAFFCLKQTTRPRNWCLRLVCNPYPFHAEIKNLDPGPLPPPPRPPHHLCVCEYLNNR